MSKNFEKKQETKELEKKLELKEHKIEKSLKQEIKEKPEKRELKEIKEFKERKEFKEYKEPIKEKIEIKEGKEFEKPDFEKDPKELVEGFDPGGEVINPRMGTTGFDAMAAPKPKEIEAAPKPKETDKAPVKDFEKQFEKAVQKEIEKIKPEKELKIEKHEVKDQKFEKIEHKEFKHEIKEVKIEFPEKHFRKDFLPEKHVFENDPKGIVENPGLPGPETDPSRRVFNAQAKPEERLTQLEDAVTKLSHFIGVDLRPDLSSGALKNEADAEGKTTGEADDKTKRPK